MKHLSKYNPDLKVAIFGLYPPPYGGISIHIQRLKDQLERYNIKCSVYNLSNHYDLYDKNVVTLKHRFAWMIKYLLNNDHGIVHYHLFDTKMLILFSMLSVLHKKKVLFTFHSFRYNTNRVTFYKVVFYMARMANISFIAVNADIKNDLISLGIRDQNIDVIPAFIPPVIQKSDTNTIPQHVLNFINCHNPIISANASRINFYDDHDLYGLDMCIDLCANLKDGYPNIGFIFYIADVDNKAYFNFIQNKIIEKNIRSNFLSVIGQYEFYPVILKSDIFVRPTNTDGDSISLREALFFNRTAIASDAVERPEGTIIFKNRDIDDFTLKTINALNKNLGEVRSTHQTNFTEKIVELYKKIYLTK